MITDTALDLPPALRAALAERGLHSFDDFMGLNDSAAVSRRGKRPVRPLQLGIDGQMRHFYLKQFRMTAAYLLTEIWKGRLPVLSGTAKERAVIRLLEQHDIPVMKVAAWGERRRLGLPTSGFLLVAAVPGEPFCDHYGGATMPMRRQLRRLHGSLIGTLHHHGIVTKVRPRDLILVAEGCHDFRQALVVIDRERGLIRPKTMPLQQRAAQLADVWCKSGTELGLGSRGELRAFLCGYFRATNMAAAERLVLQDHMHRTGLDLLRRDPAAKTSFASLWSPAC